MSLTQPIEQGLLAMGVDLPHQSRGRLAAHLELIEKWNQVHNLTAVRDTAQMVVLHLLDSLTLLPHLGGAKTLIDVGSGPGFPGIPLAIARPELSITLLDSSHKKCAFLEQARVELGLENITVACERVQQYHPEQLFDAVVSRAFAELSDFVIQSQHLAAPGGRLLAMKGVYPFEEIARVPATHRVAQVVELAVPSLEAKRHLVFMEAA
ncbi:MAG: 16S rRNA (guanine(527)-N(7))-methyltransferase RsmG [Pseudomonadota bacterium]|nr:16S rRNA (guanine(527)-N(7))-methyltransferase RsmG [Pseudomonadota bacterium]